MYIGVPRPQSRRTHCLRGHEFTPDNIYYRPADQARQCRKCIQLRRLTTDRRRVVVTCPDCSEPRVIVERPEGLVRRCRSCANTIVNATVAARAAKPAPVVPVAVDDWRTPEERESPRAWAARQSRDLWPAVSLYLDLSDQEEAA